MTSSDKTGQPLIRTRLRVKISSLDSYPIGAEKVSAALAQTLQFAKLAIHFTTHFRRHHQHSESAYLTITYSARHRTMQQANLEGISLFSEWQISVYPVLRELRHKVQGRIIEHDLPAIRDWLNDRIDLSSGSDLLAFFFSEDREEFFTDTYSKQEPILR